MILNRLKNSSFAKDTILTFTTQLIVMILGFAMNKILAIKFGIADFGIFNIAKRGGSVISFVLLMGLGISIPRYLSMSIASQKNGGEKYYSSGIFIILVNSVAALIIGFCFRNEIAIILFDSNKYATYIFPILLFAIGMTVSTFMYGAYRGSGLYLSYSVAQIIGQILIVVTVFVSFTVKSTILNWGLVTIVFTIVLVLHAYYMKKNGGNYLNLEFKFKFFPIEVRELVSYGAPRIIGEIVQFSYYLVPLILINRSYNAVQVGMFSASTSILQMFLPFFSYLGLILLPYVSTNIVQKRFGIVNSRINRLMVIYLIVAALAIVFGSVYTDSLLKILFSSDFLKSQDIVRILLLTLVPRSVFLLLRNPIDAISKIPYNTYLLACSFGLLILAILYSSNLQMIAWSFVVSDTLLAVGSIATWYLLKKKFEEKS